MKERRRRCGSAMVGDAVASDDVAEQGWATKSPATMSLSDSRATVSQNMRVAIPLVDDVADYDEGESRTARKKE